MESGIALTTVNNRLLTIDSIDLSDQILIERFFTKKKKRKMKNLESSFSIKGKIKCFLALNVEFFLNGEKKTHDSVVRNAENSIQKFDFCMINNSIWMFSSLMKWTKLTW